MRAAWGVGRAAWGCALVVTACTPTTTRARFAPMPEALHAVINAPPARVAVVAESLLVADSMRVAYVSARDAWLESREFAGTTRIRLWADPDVPGKSRVTIEATYRPFEDPSRQRRDLERAAPTESPGAQRAAKLLEALKEKLGVTVY